MAINPNIALSFQAPKIDDPLNKLAQMEQIKAYRQNALAKQMEMDAAVREREVTNALRQRLASGKELGLAEAASFGKPGMEMYQSMATAEAQQQSRQANRAKFLNEKIKQYSGMLANVSTPEQYAQVRNMATQDVPEFDKTWVSPDQWTQDWNDKTVAGTSAITKRLEMSFKRPFEIEKEINDLTSNMYTPEGVMKPEVLERVGELRGMLAEMGGGQQAAPAFAPSPKAAAPTVLEQPVIGGKQPAPPSPSFSSEPGIPLSREEATSQAKATQVGTKKAAELEAISKADRESNIRMAKRLLDRVGYNPETDSSTTEELIAGSSGGGIDTLIADAARAVGFTTPGMANIGQLKTLSSEITKDFLGGKLGAGISNPDRDFIQQMSGDIGNPNLTTGERVAAFKQFVVGLKKIAEQGYYINPQTLKPDSGSAAPASSGRASATKPASGSEMGGWVIEEVPGEKK
jgi:hypothetical protein